MKLNPLQMERMAGPEEYAAGRELVTHERGIGLFERDPPDPPQHDGGVDSRERGGQRDQDVPDDPMHRHGPKTPPILGGAAIPG